jgi:hypothetical protein
VGCREWQPSRRRKLGQLRPQYQLLIRNAPVHSGAFRIGRGRRRVHRLRDVNPCHAARDQSAQPRWLRPDSVMSQVGHLRPFDHAPITSGLPR